MATIYYVKDDNNIITATNNDGNDTVVLATDSGVISWSPEDLIQCKNALRIMLMDDIDCDVINAIDYDGNFGNLDVDAVIDEWFFGE